MISPARMPAPPRAATYGALLATATDQVTHAQADGLGPFADPQTAADTVIDYERFLAVSGRHLQLLLSPAPSTASSDQAMPRQVAAVLAALGMERRGNNPWTAAGDTLGLAHDLLATHVGPRGEVRTPDAAILTQTAVQDAAAARVLTLVREPLSVSRDLLRAAAQVQPETAPPLTRSMSTHLRQTTARLVRTLDRATPMRLADADLLAPLDDLPLALTKVGADTHPDALTSGAAALRLLRQISQRQSQGDESANAHTLQELCVLAVTTCKAAEELLPDAATPLGRVDRAAAVDKLRRAGALWGQLGGSLYPRVQGLSKAPGIYHHAIQVVSQASRAHPSATCAVLASLPRLGLQSATTLQTLHSKGELVTSSRDPGKLTARWRALTPAEAQILADGFVAASRASRHANDAVRRQLEQRGGQHSRPSLPQQRQRSLGLGASR